MVWNNPHSHHQQLRVGPALGQSGKMSASVRGQSRVVKGTTARRRPRQPSRHATVGPPTHSRSAFTYHGNRVDSFVKRRSPAESACAVLALNGCVSRDVAAPDQFMLSDSEAGATYRLSGTSVRTYVGKRVQVRGNLDSRRLHITGGLMPSPNVAAQAGAIDPAQAAMAGASGSAGTGSAPFATLHVTRVPPLDGPCPER